MPTWYLDTSSLISLRSAISRTDLKHVLEGLARIVSEGRLKFPREVIHELERYAGETNPALLWARQQPSAISTASFDVVKEVLAQVPEILDPDKEGVEEADTYVLALAFAARRNGEDARVVTEEFKTTVAKMPLGSAAGYLGIPSVSIRTMLKFEGIKDFAPVDPAR